MFYVMYLTGLCTRRSWPAPQFTLFRNQSGHGCVVRVNNREYSTGETVYESEDLARNAAATQAYMICRNFSVNDGMMPGQKPSMAASEPGCQGLPVAIGAGRRDRFGALSSSSQDPSDWSSCSSGEVSPRCPPDGFNGRMDSVVTLRTSEAEANGGSSSSSSRRSSSNICSCRRAYATAHGQCARCYRDTQSTSV